MMWNDHVGFHFCESRLSSSGSIHEPINAFSSLIFIGYAMYILYSHKQHNHHTIFCCSLLTICGIGSFLFHMHLCELFRLMDEGPMILLSCYSAYFFSSSILGNTSCRCFFWMLYAVILLACNPFIEPNIFRTLFGIPLAYSIYTLLHVYTIFYEEIHAIVLSSVIALLFWIIDMHFCNPITKLFLLHTWWHVCIGYTAFKLIQVARIISLSIV